MVALSGCLLVVFFPLNITKLAGFMDVQVEVFFPPDGYFDGYQTNDRRFNVQTDGHVLTVNLVSTER